MFLSQGQPVELVVQMKGTPIWLTITTLAVSGLALAVSALQYLTNRAESMRVRPDIRMSVLYSDHIQLGAPTLLKLVAVDVWNKGREATKIEQLWAFGDSSALNGLNNLVDGTTGIRLTRLEHQRVSRTIEGFSSESFYIDGNAVDEERFTVMATFGHGLSITQVVELNQPGSSATKRTLSWRPWTRSRSVSWPRKKSS